MAEMKNFENKDLFAIGEKYLESATLSKFESEYIEAEQLYKMSMEVFSGLMKEEAEYKLQAKGAYMDAVYSYALLPQMRYAEKEFYLNEAHTLAKELQKETADIAYAVAVDCISAEMEAMQLEEQTLSKRRKELQF